MPQSSNATEREKRIEYTPSNIAHIVQFCLVILMFVLSEILWIIKCTFYLGDKCKKIRCQCANLITGALPIHVGCHAPLPRCPYLFLADLITLKWIRVHFIKSRKLISSDIDFYGHAIKDYFTGCSRFSSTSSPHSLEPLHIVWHVTDTFHFEIY